MWDCRKMSYKKTIITICIALAVVAVTGLFLDIQKNDETLVQTEKQENEQNKKYNAIDSTLRNTETRDDIKDSAQLKNDNSLVWYEIPELNVHFKVAPNTDLRYFVEDDSAYFYMQSIVDFLGHDYCLNGSDNLMSCTIFAIEKRSHDTDNEQLCDDVFPINEKEFICYSKPQTGMFESKEHYQLYVNHTKTTTEPKESVQEIYLKETIEEIHSDTTKGEDSFVWYEIPELNIKFYVTKEIADHLRYDQEFVENKPINGYKLYSKSLDTNNQSKYFSLIIEYQNHKNSEHYNQIMRSCENVLLETKQRLICYNDKTNKKNNIHDSITKKLFDGYLKTVPVEEIK